MGRQPRRGRRVRPRRDFEALTARRMQAAEMFARGKRQVDVVTELGVSAQTASRWHRAFAERGRDGLAGAGRAGRRPGAPVLPGEAYPDTIIREVKEETGIEITPGEILRERVHPKTDRHMVYVAARPTGKLDAIVGDPDELSEVRWASLAEAEELLPGIFEPVHEHLERVLRS